MPDMTAPVDGVEIKYTMSGAQLKAALESFTLRPADAKPQVVYFFESLDEPRDGAAGNDGPALRLLSAGVVLRLRRKASGSGTTTLKLRPALQDRLTVDWAAGAGVFDDYTVEYDWSRHPVLAASLGADADKDPIAAVLNGTKPVRTLFSADQTRFLTEAGTPPTHPFDGLRLAGPISAQRWDDIADGSFDGSAGLRAEQWEYGDGRSFLEFSTRVDHVEDARLRRRQLGAELKRRHLVPDTGAMSKTETVLRALLGERP